jgi:hypothetical protein
MSEEVKVTTPVVSETPKNVTKYYTSKVYGLTLLKDGDPNKTLRFQPFFETYQGDNVRVGYVSTDDKDFIKLLDEDLSVEELTKSEYDKATGDKARPASYATA